MRTADWTETTSVLDRFTAILDTFGDDTGLGVSEIARRANLPKSTVSRIVTDLVRQGYLERDGGTLHLGLTIFELGQAVRLPTRLRRLAHPIMLRLRDLLGETVQLGVMDTEEVVLIASISTGDDPARQSGTGARSPAPASALGRAILAHSPVEVQQAAAATHPELLRELAEVRRTGVAASHSNAGASVATAVIAAGTPIGALAVTGAASVVDSGRTRGLVCAAAAALGRQWSHPGTP